MKTKVVAVTAILLASTLWLAGCTYVGFGGPPCYGFGCHAGLSAPSGKSQSAARQNDRKTPTANQLAPGSKGPERGN